MNKRLTLVSVPVALLLGLGVSSWYVGQQTATALPQFIAQQNRQWAPFGLSQEVVSYEKTLFGAKAVTRLGVDTPGIGKLVDEVQFVHQITNGPVLFGGGRPVQLGLARIDTQIDTQALPAEKQQWLNTLFDNKPPLTGTTILGIGQTASYDWQVNPFKFAQDGKQYSADGIHLTGDTGADALGEFTVDVENAALQQAGNQVSLPELSIEGASTNEDKGPVFDLSIQAPQMSLLAEGTTEPFVSDMDWQLHTATAGTDKEGQVKLQLANIKGMKDVLNQLNYQLDFKGLDAVGLQTFLQLQAQIQNDISQMDWNAEALETPEGQQKQQELMNKVNVSSEQALNTLFGQILKAGKSQLQSHLTTDGTKGKLNMALDLTYIGQNKPTTMDLLTYGPNDWANLLQGKVALTADKGMLPEGVEPLLMPYTQQGVLVQSKEQYATDIQWKGQNVTMNGKNMSFEALLQTMGVGSAGSNSTLTQTAKDLGLPEDLMQMIEKQGLTPEIMQLLEESDDVPPETVEILKKLQEVQQQVPAEEVNEPTKP